MNYDQMTIADLEKKNNELRAQQMEIKEERLKINAAISEKELHREAVMALQRMGPEKAKALHQAISKAGSVESLEKMGTPGA